MITNKEAIHFLKLHQPMPDDNEIKEEEIKQYEEVRNFFIHNPDEQCLSLFLNSFGGKDGFGVYQMVEDIFLMYDEKKVLPYILQSLSSSNDSIKYWSAQIASNYLNISLFVPLIDLLKHEDIDIKMAAITALAQFALNNIKTDTVIRMIREECKKTSDGDIIEFCKEVLLDIENSTL